MKTKLKFDDKILFEVGDKIKFELVDRSGFVPVVTPVTGKILKITCGYDLGPVLNSITVRLKGQLVNIPAHLIRFGDVTTPSASFSVELA